jgi:O-antigen ligase
VKAAPEPVEEGGGRSASRLGPVLALGSALALTATLWADAQPDLVVPKVVGSLGFILVSVVVSARFPEVLVALLLVGQSFLKAAPGLQGGTRSAVSPALAALGGVLAVVLLARLPRHGPFLPSTVAGPFGRTSRSVLLAATALGLVLVLNLPRSPRPGYGATKTLGYLSFDLVPMGLILLFVTTRRELARLVTAIAVIGVLTAVLTEVYTLVTFKSPFGDGLIRFDQVDFHGLRVYGGVFFARRASFGALAAAVLAYRLRSRPAARLAAASVVFVWVVIALAGRGPFVAFTFGLLLFVALARRLSRAAPTDRRPALVLPVLLLVGIVAFGAVTLPERLQSRYGVSQAQSELRLYRYRFYANAWGVFVSHPLTGVGTGGWRSYYHGPDQEVENVYPHNIVLELAAETGLAGLVPFLLMIGVAVRAGVRLYRDREASADDRRWAAWGLSLLFVALLNALVSGDIQINDLVWASVAVVAVVTSISQRARVPERLEPAVVR